MFHLVNAGAAQELSFSIDKHDLWIVSADGAYVKPIKVQVGKTFNANRGQPTKNRSLDSGPGDRATLWYSRTTSRRRIPQLSRSGYYPYPPAI